MNRAYVPAALRRYGRNRAKNRCEYCLLPQTVAFFLHEPDHVRARKHGGEAIAENLALSCFDCNRFKGSDLASIDPRTGEIAALFNPRNQAWTDHFRTEGGTIVPLTAAGRVTERLLKLNLPERVEVRQLLADSGLFP